MTLRYWGQVELTTTTKENPRPGAIIKNPRDLLPRCLPKGCFCSAVYLPSHTRGRCFSSFPPSSLFSPSPSNILVTSSHRGAPSLAFFGLWQSDFHLWLRHHTAASGLSLFSFTYKDASQIQGPPEPHMLSLKST